MTTVYVTHPRYVEHTMNGHPEHAGRIEAVWQKLEAARVLGRMKIIQNPQPVTEAMIRTVHTEDYVEKLRWISAQDQPFYFDTDTYTLPVTPEIARLSAGGVVAAVDAVLGDGAQNALVAVRPPGHHALPNRAMGFCVLGNVPIAVHVARQKYGVERVMIVDYDVHHGNGTQEMFYDDDSVLFVSTHQSPFYPGTGGINEMGRGKGEGYTLNIPLAAGCGDRNYLQVYREVIWAAARRFKPQLLMVSAGFDAHWTDPLARMQLSLEGYAQISRELVTMAETFCDGKIIFVLEGGYDLNALGYGMQNVAHALLNDDEITDPLGQRGANEPNISALIEKVKQAHQL